jgi:hypothetical protein
MNLSQSIFAIHSTLEYAQRYAQQKVIISLIIRNPHFLQTMSEES